MTKYGKDKKARKFAELYETPESVTLPLIDRLGLQGVIWEPFAGSGKVCRAFLSRGYSVIASDIIDYGYPLDFQGDFFDLEAPPEGFDHVISNPPYGSRNGLIPPIVQKLLSFRKRHSVVALLLPSEFDFGKGPRRTEIFCDCPYYRGQIKVMDRIKWEEDSAGTGTENHAWQIWGPTDWTWDRSKRLPVVDYMRQAI